MKKALILALSLSLAGMAAQAQTASVQPANVQQKVAGPQIQFEEMKYDFGSVKQGDVVEHVFKFKNTGTAPLVIANIGTTCGCTVPAWTKEPIMPGKSGTVTAKFSSAGKMGMQNKVLTVESNSVGGNAMVSLVGEVKDAATATTEAMPTKAALSTDQSEVKEKTKLSDSKTKAKRKSS